MFPLRRPASVPNFALIYHKYIYFKSYIYILGRIYYQILHTQLLLQRGPANVNPKGGHVQRAPIACLQLLRSDNVAKVTPDELTRIRNKLEQGCRLLISDFL